MTDPERALRDRLTRAGEAVDAAGRWDEVVAEAEHRPDAPVSLLRRHRSLILLAGIAASILVGVLLTRGDDPAEVRTDVVDEGPVSTTTTTEPPTTSTSTTAATSAPAQPEFPAESTNLVHGGDIWAVVLAVGSDPQDPALQKAAADAADAGYFAGPTDCDQGAPEALGVDRSVPGVFSVSVYFDTEADARAAVDAFEARSIPAVAAVVQTFCLD